MGGLGGGEASLPPTNIPCWLESVERNRNRVERAQNDQNDPPVAFRNDLKVRLKNEAPTAHPRRKAYEGLKSPKTRKHLTILSH